jgi:hypothetical protein
MGDNSTYYLLGYYSTNKRADGRFRKIEVKVKGRDVEVRARRGYTAPSAREAERRAEMDAAVEPSAVLRDVFQRPLPASGVPLRAFAAPFKGEGSKASVLFGLEVDAQQFRFEQAEGLYTDRMEAAVIAMNDEGKFLDGDRHSVELKLRPQTHQAVLANGLRLLFRVELAPGRYQFRAAAHETGTGAVGSVYYDVVVPDFAAQPLSMSGVVLTSTNAAAVPTPRPDPELAALLRQPPTGSRNFVADETVTAAFALYANPRKATGTVDVTTTLRDEGGQVRFSHDTEASEAELRAAMNGYGYVVEVPLKDIPPGPYMLRIEAVSRLRDVPAMVRELPINVRAARP